MRTLLAFALVLGLIGGWSPDAEARKATLAGAWFVTVSPQAAEPEFPQAPPPFESMFDFGVSRSLTESDSGLNANALVTLFPPDVFPPFTGSDGIGSWKRTGGNRFRCTFIKFLFDEQGAQVGFVNTTLDLVVRRDGSLRGRGASDFVKGRDPRGPVFFSGPVLLKGSRIKVAD